MIEKGIGGDDRSVSLRRQFIVILVIFVRVWCLRLGWEGLCKRFEIYLKISR